MTRRVLTILVFSALTFGTSRLTLADDGPLRMRTGSTCTTTGGSTVTLPPGYFLPEPTWGKFDAEIRRLQGEETRLSAENKTLRDLTDSTAGRTLRYLMIGAAIGVAAGFAAGAYYF